uniref:Uncharacterized protein n=1 Tax=Zooxanthella nutricula TaxID=1333877 RepID=A0A7S2KK97_9DINO
MFRAGVSALALVAAAWGAPAAPSDEAVCPAGAACGARAAAAEEAALLQVQGPNTWGQTTPAPSVQCTYSGTYCAGDQCCPRAPETGDKTYPCPSASPKFIGCDVTTTWWLYGEVMRLRGQIDALSANQTHLTSQVDALRADDTQLRAEVDALRANETQLKAEVDAMAENQTHLQTTVGALEDNETRLQAEVEALNATVQESCGLFVKDGDTLVLKGAKLMVEADCSSGPVLSTSCLSASVQ